MASITKWRNHQNIYCVDCFLPSTKFSTDSKGEIMSCVFPDSQTISVGDVVDGKTIKKIMKNSDSLMLITEINLEEFQKQLDSCDIPVEEILQEHLRTSYRHNITPFEGVPVLEGEVAKRFVDICDNNSKLASSEYDKSRNDWVNNILSKKHL